LRQTVSLGVFQCAMGDADTFHVGKKGQPGHDTTHFHSTAPFQAHNQKAKLHSAQQAHSTPFTLQNKSSGIVFIEKMPVGV